MMPSILIFTGELEVKKRAEALRSAISFSSGLTLNRPSCCGSAAIASSPGGCLVDFAVVGLIDDPQRAGRLRLQAVLALALELDAQAQLVLRDGVAQAFLVGNRAALVEFEQRLVEGL